MFFFITIMLKGVVRTLLCSVFKYDTLLTFAAFNLLMVLKLTMEHLKKIDLLS